MGQNAIATTHEPVSFNCKRKALILGNPSAVSIADFTWIVCARPVRASRRATGVNGRGEASGPRRDQHKKEHAKVSTDTKKQGYRAGKQQREQQLEQQCKQQRKQELEQQRKQRESRVKARELARERLATSAKQNHEPSAEPAKASSASRDQIQEPRDSDTDLIVEPTAIPDVDASHVIDHPDWRLLPSTSQSARSSSPEEESVTAYYRHIAEVLSLDNSTLEAIRANPSIILAALASSNMEAKKQGLDRRNVAWDPCESPDPFEAPREVHTPSSVIDATSSRGWIDDLDKCDKDPQEFIFQRTIMMSILNRHHFIPRNEKNVLDFAVERMWDTPYMPTKEQEEQNPSYTLPKPDVAVAFQTKKLIPVLQTIPAELRKVVCYEGINSPQNIRAFHFFIIEAKNKFTTTDDPVALAQVLNTATQSLHNLYEFFNEAGPKHLEEFFDKVRVFTAVSTVRGILIRSHRACLAAGFRDDTSTLRSLPLAKPAVLDSYPLQFEYDVYFRTGFDLSDFTHDKVVSKVGEILIQYGAHTLYNLLEEAAKDVIKVFTNEKGESRDVERPKLYYSHFQEPPLPPQKHQSKRGSRRTQTNISSAQHDTEKIEKHPLSELQEKMREQQRRTCRENIQKMHALDKPRQPPPRRTGGDPNASMSEGLEDVSIQDPARSSVGLPDAGTINAENPAQHVSNKKKHGRPEGDITESGGPAGSTRPKRPKPK